jgi:hypothetical protein
VNSVLAEKSFPKLGKYSLGGDPTFFSVRCHKAAAIKK